jgi:hypothetical protein
MRKEDQLDRATNQIKNILLEKLSEKYHLVENQGQICIDWKGTKIFIINCAIHKIYNLMFPPYIFIRGFLQSAMDTVFTNPENHTKESVEEADKVIAPLIARLMYLCVDHSKTDIDILIRKLNNDKNSEDHALFLIDFIQTVDYAVCRGQELQNLMEDAMKSGDIEKIKALDSSNILPYELIAHVGSLEELEAMVKSIPKNIAEEKKEDNLFDLRGMKVIGEA